MTFDPDPDSNVVICMPVKDGPAALPCVVEACAKCNQPVWIGIDLLAQLRLQDVPVVPLCGPCGMVEIPAGARLELHPSQRAPLLAVGIDPDEAFENAQRFIDHAKAQQKKADA